MIVAAVLSVRATLIDIVFSMHYCCYNYTPFIAHLMFGLRYISRADQILRALHCLGSTSHGIGRTLMEVHRSVLIVRMAGAWREKNRQQHSLISWTVCRSSITCFIFDGFPVCLRHTCELRRRKNCPRALKRHSFLVFHSVLENNRIYGGRCTGAVREDGLWSAVHLPHSSQDTH